jgi:hypothetical protein
VPAVLAVPACRSVVEGSTRMVSTMQAKMLSRAGQKGAGQCIRASIPYVRADIPILIIFRALGFVVSGALEGQGRAGQGRDWGLWLGCVGRRSRGLQGDFAVCIIAASPPAPSQVSLPLPAWRHLAG